MLKEFAIHLANQYLFPLSEDKQYLTAQDFMRVMEEEKYILIKPHDIRKKYTEFVW